VLVNIWEGVGARGEAERFREIWGIEGTILLDESADYAQQLDIRGVPTNVLVDADGTVQAVGLVRLDELEAAIDRLVGR
jgi:predicted DsbA family dithiol-disulfide isomerase